MLPTYYYYWPLIGGLTVLGVIAVWAIGAAIRRRLPLCSDTRGLGLDALPMHVFLVGIFTILFLSFRYGYPTPAGFDKGWFAWGAMWGDIEIVQAALIRAQGNAEHPVFVPKTKAFDSIKHGRRFFDKDLRSKATRAYIDQSYKVEYYTSTFGFQQYILVPLYRAYLYFDQKDGTLHADLLAVCLSLSRTVFAALAAGVFLLLFVWVREEFGANVAFLAASGLVLFAPWLTTFAKNSWYGGGFMLLPTDSRGFSEILCKKMRNNCNISDQARIFPYSQARYDELETANG